MKKEFTKKNRTTETGTCFERGSKPRKYLYVTKDTTAEDVKTFVGANVTVHSAERGFVVVFEDDDTPSADYYQIGRYIVQLAGSSAPDCTVSYTQEQFDEHYAKEN